MKPAALQIFHQQPANLNCAQSVIYAYGSVSGDNCHRVEDFSKSGGGRAPNGTCGALYAACQVVPESTGSLTQRFAERVGSSACREIKGGSAHLCEECVGTASELLEETLMGKPSERIRIALPMHGEFFSDHFGGSTHFRLIDANRTTKRVFRQTDAPAPEHVPGAFPKWLADQGVHCVIAGSIGKRAVQMLAAANIPVFIAKEGASPAESVALQLEGSLAQPAMEDCCPGHDHDHCS